MAELKQFRLPDVGEGLTEADILRWEVKVGDAVVVNQVLVEVETAKAAVELPSPYAGHRARDPLRRGRHGGRRPTDRHAAGRRRRATGAARRRSGGRYRWRRGGRCR